MPKKIIALLGVLLLGLQVEAGRDKNEAIIVSIEDKHGRIPSHVRSTLIASDYDPLTIREMAFSAAGTSHAEVLLSDATVAGKISSQAATIASQQAELETLRALLARQSDDSVISLRRVQAELEAMTTARDEALSTKSTMEAARDAALVEKATALLAKAAAEDERDDALADKATALLAKAAAEDERDDALADKATAETARDTALTAKATAEAAQATAEAAQATAEGERDTFSTTLAALRTSILGGFVVEPADAAEQETSALLTSLLTEKTTAETARDAALTAKATAEAAQATAETAQATAEGERDDALADKATAETARDAALTAKATAEAAQATAEAAQAAAEDERDDALADKATAETARDAALTAKATAEAARDTAQASLATVTTERDAAESAFSDYVVRVVNALSAPIPDGSTDDEQLDALIAERDAAQDIADDATSAKSSLVESANTLGGGVTDANTFVVIADAISAGVGGGGGGGGGPPFM